MSRNSLFSVSCRHALQSISLSPPPLVYFLDPPLQSKKRGFSLEEKSQAMIGIFHESADVFVLKVCLFSPLSLHFFFQSPKFSYQRRKPRPRPLPLFSQTHQPTNAGHREARPQARRRAPSREGGPPGPRRRGPRSLREDRDLQLFLVSDLFLSIGREREKE